MMATKTYAQICKAVVMGLVALGATRVEGHCDTMDGPVVVDAKAALANADVRGVLKWVTPEHEDEIRAAFDKTLAVRVKGPDARALADMYFFETLVRIHRAGEGAPYTGLKPVGTDPGPAISAADRALATGDVDALAKRIGEQAETGVRERFARAIQTKPYADKDTKAGREFVAAYVEFVHYVERLHQAVTGHGGHHAEGASETQQQVGNTPRSTYPIAQSSTLRQADTLKPMHCSVRQNALYSLSF